MKTALVCGAGGFIGSHLGKKLKEEGYWVRGVDLKEPEYLDIDLVADEFVVGDLRDPQVVSKVLDQNFDRVYQLAADMGGAGFCFTGENDADIMHNSALCNLNIAYRAAEIGLTGRIFYSSSACIYPGFKQDEAGDPKLYEYLAYPAEPDSEYGWEKLFSERMYFAFARNKGLDVRVARFHNIFGPEGTWTGGREKAPAAICRKVAESKNGKIEIWGDGKQTRSFLLVDDCLEAIEKLMLCETFHGPVNIGSEEMVSINELAEIVMDIAGKPLEIVHIEGPLGVRGRNSENTLIREKLQWEPRHTLRQGLEKTYAWIKEQVDQLG